MFSNALRAAAGALLLAAVPLSSCSRSGERIPLSVSPGATLSVAASWSPITEYSMDVFERFPGYFKYSPTEPVRTYGSDEFAAFLPSEPKALGEIWPLDMERVMTFWRQFDASARTRLHHGRTPKRFAARPGSEELIFGLDIAMKYATVRLQAIARCTTTSSAAR